MSELDITLDTNSFNLIWKSLHAREQNLLRVMEEYGEDSDEGADALNDLAYLRLYKEGLREKAEKAFHPNSFIVDDQATFGL
ncbi:hypothetical protein [Oceanobacter mangrovi]|uniref:hypothetical protein n=1 Tax=Oceanobacter mangrovi TaxID=2862510 RepID=UPI001C8E3361|nr:hypothetical protein [Oceanobacter mangrovi]